MSRRRATLKPMDLEQEARMVASICDFILLSGGDDDATLAALHRAYDGEELDEAMVFGLVLLVIYEEPGGPAFLRGMRDRRRRLVPAQPAGAPGRGFLRRRPA